MTHLLDKSGSSFDSEKSLKVAQRTTEDDGEDIWTDGQYMIDLQPCAPQCIDSDTSSNGIHKLE